MYIDPLASTAPAMPPPGAMVDKVREKKALEELEHLFIFMLMKEMRNSVPADGLFGESSELRTYTEMFDDAASEEMAKAGQFGIAKMMDQQLRIREMQEKLAGQPGPHVGAAGIPMVPAFELAPLRVPLLDFPRIKNDFLLPINDNGPFDLGPGE